MSSQTLSAAPASFTADSDALQQRIDATVARFQPQFDQVERDGEALGDEIGKPKPGEAVINVDFDLQWVNKEIVIDVPEITVRNQTIALDIPEVTSSSRRVVFSVPVTKMERFCVAKVPKIYGLGKVKMECVYADKPVVRMEPREIVTDIPQVTMRRREIVLGVPQVTMRPRTMKVKLPEITLKNIRAETKRVEEKGEALKARAEEVSREMTAAIEAELRGGEGGFAAALQPQFAQVDQAFDQAAADLATAIQKTQAAGVDPIKVPAEDGDVNLRKTLSDLVAQRQAATASLQKATDFVD